MEMMSMKVDLPAPLGPISAVSFHGSTDALMLCSTLYIT